MSQRSSFKGCFPWSDIQSGWLLCPIPDRPQGAEPGRNRNFLILRYDNQAAGVLAGGSLYSGEAGCQTALLNLGNLPPRSSRYFYIAVGGFLCYSAYSSGAENVLCSEKLYSVP